MSNKINPSIEVSRALGPKVSKQRHLVGGAILSALSMGVSSGAYAQASAGESASGYREEIIVTAQRREQNLQDVPLAITALSEDAIRRSDISDISKLEGQVTGLVVANGAERTNISIRGVGSTITNIAGEAGVPVNVDGVYMTRTALSGSTYADLAQIEVLRGPQGTLYGRNATAGTVNIFTKLPDGSTDGDVSILAGNGERYRVRGALGFPIAGDSLSARISLDSESLGGYADNLFLDEKADPEEHISGRGTLRWIASDTVELVLRASVSDDDVGGPLLHLGATVGPRNPLAYGGLTSVSATEVNHDERTRIEYRDRLFSGTLTWDIGDMTLKAISAYQSHGLEADFDGDGTADTAIAGSDITDPFGNFIAPDQLGAPHTNVNLDEYSDAFTQEVTLSGATTKLDWVVGAWYMDDDVDLKARFRFTGARLPFAALGTDYTQKTEAMALFGQATYSVTDALRTTVGLRYSDETKTFGFSRFAIPSPNPFAGECGPDTAKVSYDDLSPKFGVDYDIADNVLVFASATKGFKAGGGNISLCDNTYDPEQIWAYEAGIKSQWMDGSVLLNLNAYQYDYEDYQASQLDGVALRTENAANAEIRGIEAELGFRPNERFSVNVGLAISDSEFTEYDAPLQFAPPGSTATVSLAGNSLIAAPEFSGNIALQYDLPTDSGALTLRGEHQWSSEVFFDAYNNPITSQDSYGISNARIAYVIETGTFSGLEASLFVKNLEDKEIKNRSDYSGLFGGAREAYQRPRTFGAELRYRFGQ